MFHLLEHVDIFNCTDFYTGIGMKVEKDNLEVE